MEASTSGNGMFDYQSLTEFTNRVEIYQGRHSRVWTAICTKTKKSVIVKGYIKDKMVARHFTQVMREIEIMKKINNLGVVMILGSFQDARMIYIVQEHCSRGDLFNRLMDRGGMLGEAEVATKVCTPMLIALAKCHGNNIIHRDIKPENIFIDKEDRIRLGDFGLAIDKTKDRPVSRIGTLDYMAPEVIAMPAEQDPAKGPVKIYDDKVDVWAIGILAYECIAGRPPFEVEDERQTTFLIVTAQISSFPPQFSSLAIDFIQLALRKDPRQRPSASKLLQHPWIFPHYKRYVEDTGDDLIGLFGAPTLTTPIQQLRPSAGVTPPPAPVPATPPSHGTPGRVGGGEGFKPGPAAGAQTPSRPGELPPIGGRAGGGEAEAHGAKNGVRPAVVGTVSNGATPAAKLAAMGGPSAVGPKASMPLGGKSSFTAAASNGNASPRTGGLFKNSKIAPSPAASGLGAAPVGQADKDKRFSVAGMFSKFLVSGTVEKKR